MVTLRKLALGAFMTVSALSAVTMTSCNKDDDKTCAVGYTGSDCKTMVATNYAMNTYKGNGTDNKSGTYTGWSARVTPASTTDGTKILITLQDATGVGAFAFNATLTTNNAFTIDATNALGYTYTGNGTVNESSLSLNINQQDNSGGGDNLVITFASMVKQ